MEYNYYNYPEEYLMHFGIKGMKWGVRRYQNKDGTLTPAGKKRLSKNEAYRDKLVEKSRKKSKRYQDLAEEAEYNVKDLKKHGINSKAYRDWQESERFDRAWDYDTEKHGKSYKVSGTRLLDEILDYATRDYKIQELINENRDDAKRYRDTSKRWMETNKELMNMEVTALTTKRDIRRRWRD